MFGKILIATDGSVSSGRAMTHAIEMAAQDHAELLAVTVVPRTAMHYYDGISVPDAEDVAQAELASMQNAHASLAIHVDRAKARNVALSTHTVVSDSVADAVVAASRQFGSDLIMVGGRNSRWFLQWLRAGDAQRILATSDVPVLVVHAV